MSTPTPHSRTVAILGHPQAVGREALARHLADNTGMTANEAIATLQASPRSNDAPGVAEGIAASAAATTARAMLGFKPDPAADAAIGERIAASHATEEAERRRVAAEREQAEKDFVEGRAAAERLLGRRH